LIILKLVNKKSLKHKITFWSFMLNKMY